MLPLNPGGRDSKLPFSKGAALVGSIPVARQLRRHTATKQSLWVNERPVFEIPPLRLSCVGIVFMLSPFLVHSTVWLIPPQAHSCAWIGPGDTRTKIHICALPPFFCRSCAKIRSGHV